MDFGVYFAREGYTTDKPKLMGRHAAGASFIRGMLRYSTADTLSILIDSEEDITEFKALAKEFRPTIATNVISRENLRDLREIDGLYLPGPDIGKAAFERSIADKLGDSWALCGITHTTSSAHAMDSIASLITAPVQKWDAVVCTSSAVKKNVETILQAQVDHLKNRLGISRITIPLLPVIPLGIHTEDFSATVAQKAEARSCIGARDQDIVVLYTGRLSFHAKAHPLSMYQALEAAAKETNKSLILVECGWHANGYIKDSFEEAAKLACPSVRVVGLDGREKSNRQTAWACADIFCSLSDNIQETFGIVPLEAMAAGLPVVVTDWDGYRDTVRDGIDGFRIPTITPSPGLAGDIAYRHALNIDTYDMYCGHSSSMVALHHGKLKNAFVDLIRSPELRSRMGEEGRERAISEYDWEVIFPRYEALWSEQTDLRLSAKRSARDDPTKARPVSYWPARLDPTIGFAGYATEHMTEETLLVFLEESTSSALEKLKLFKKLNMVSYTNIARPTEDEIASIFETAEERSPKPTRAGHLISGLEKKRHPFALRGLTWLCKLGFFDFK